MKSGTSKDKRLFEKVREVINKFNSEDLYGNRCPYHDYECEVGGIAYLIKKTKFTYITEFAKELCNYNYLCYIDFEDCIPIARELMIAVYGYEPPLEME